MLALLNQLAVSFDLPILDWIQAHLQCGFLDAVMPIVTLFGEGGIFWIAWAVLMLVFPKTRKTGIAMGIAWPIYADADTWRVVVFLYAFAASVMPM